MKNDKRYIKTEREILVAFANALSKKDFSNITIEDILKETNISRSTFYKHYKNKNEVLSSVTDHIFSHVLSHSLDEEKTHDFSKSSIFEYTHLITHVLYHLHDEKYLIKAIISNGCTDEFYKNLRKLVRPIAEIIINNNLVTKKDIPIELYIESICSDFNIIIAYWFKNGCNESPEVMTKYFFDLIQ